MTDGELGPRARDCLARAGWTPRRRIDIAAHVRQLEADGYPVFEAVRDFLSRFGELTLRYPHFRVPAHEDSCHFDAAAATRSISSRTITAYAEAIGKPVCPIGAAFSGHMTLLMTERGAVYAAYEDTLIRLAESPVDAINELCEGRDDHQRIPLPGFFDDRHRGEPAKGRALDELLAAATGPTGPQSAVDLGMPGLFEQLGAMLSRCNGFTAFDGGLRVFRAGEPGQGPELSAWNEPAVWKDAYGPLADNLFCFGQDVFGAQHAFELAHGGVVVLDPESGSKAFAGSSLEEWAAWLFEEPDCEVAGLVTRAYEAAHGPLRPDQCLLPITPLREGGEYEPENFTAVDLVEAMRVRGPEAQRRRADESSAP